MARNGLSRREALTAGGGAAAGVVLANAPTAVAKRSRHTRPIKRADVVVVGAGISGLTAARRLVKAGVRSVVVLEAGDRVGGRTVNLDMGDGVVSEGGGEWVGPGQDAGLGLIKELGLSTFKTYVEGKTIYQLDGKRQTYEGTIPPLLPASLIDYAQMETRLEQMASSVPAEAPWTAPNAVEWDSITFGAWLDTNSTSSETKFLFALAFATIFGEDPHETSLLRVLHAIASSDGIEHMVNVTNGAQERRIVGGSQQLSLVMVKQLGRRVVLSSPVSSIHQHKNDVLVTSKRATVRCRRVIVAMSPADAERIDFSPGLPGRRAILQRKWHNGTESKLFAVYDKPFWRDDGFSGQAITDLPLASYVIDNSPPDGKLGVLLTFMGTSGSGPGLTWSDDLLNSTSARRATFIQDLTTLFGPKASKPLRYVEKDWSREPWIAGCVSTRSPGTLTRYTNAARESVGRVHWAGTETAIRYEGYMDGAVSAGERAAKEVADAL